MRVPGTGFRIALAAFFALALTISTAGTVAADPLGDAKASGLLGERPDGYLGAVAGSIPGDVAALMDRINAMRLAHYQSIAQKNKTTLESVQAIVGAKVIMEKVRPGEYFMNSSGRWVRK